MSGVACPQCMSQKSTVNETRPVAGTTVRRARICQGCGTRFTTVEIPIPNGLTKGEMETFFSKKGFWDVGKKILQQAFTPQKGEPYFGISEDLKLGKARTLALRSSGEDSAS